MLSVLIGTLFIVSASFVFFFIFKRTTSFKERLLSVVFMGLCHVITMNVVYGIVKLGL